MNNVNRVLQQYSLNKKPYLGQYSENKNKSNSFHDTLNTICTLTTRHQNSSGA